MSNFYDKTDKYRQWEVICYPENMIDDWQEKIDSIIQLPCCWILHDKDLEKSEEDEQRKVHVHLWIVWNNTTTFSNALKHANRLSKRDEDGKIIKNCCSTAQAVHNPEIAYKYLIHADEKSIKKGKHLYSEDERHCCNNFDIGTLVDISVEEATIIKAEISDAIISQNIQDMANLYLFVKTQFDERHLTVFMNYCNYFDKITTGVWKHWKRKKEEEKEV